jgi:hypothetical protein
MTGWVEQGELFAEAQGSFAPEVLNPEGDNDVLSRRFHSKESWLDIEIAPTSEYLRTHPLEDTWPDEYEVSLCVERREAGDEGGDTSDYRWEDILDGPVTYEEALKAARHYIENVKPDEEMKRFD